MDRANFGVSSQQNVQKNSQCQWKQDWKQMSLYTRDVYKDNFTFTIPCLFPCLKSLFWQEPLIAGKLPTYLTLTCLQLFIHQHFEILLIR